MVGPQRHPSQRAVPGLLLTEMTEIGLKPLQANIAANSLLGRFGAQDELDPAAHLPAQPACACTTGAALVVDGGMAAL
jgi:NAD(P)-dependent dehydrogenase (short-subunit alcohol dehydrogenase family)